MAGRGQATAPRSCWLNESAFSMKIFRMAPMCTMIRLITLMLLALPAVFVLYAGYRYGWDERMNGLALAVVGVTSIVVQAGLVGRVVKALGERRNLLRRDEPHEFEVERPQRHTQAHCSGRRHSRWRTASKRAAPLDATQPRQGRRGAALPLLLLLLPLRRRRRGPGDRGEVDVDEPGGADRTDTVGKRRVEQCDEPRDPAFDELLDLRDRHACRGDLHLVEAVEDAVLDSGPNSKFIDAQTHSGHRFPIRGLYPLLNKV